MYDHVDILELMKKIIRGRGISFVIEDDESPDPNSDVAYAPVNPKSSTLTIDDAITSQLTKFSAALIAESYAALMSDAGMQADTSRLPLTVDDQGNIQITPNPSLPLSSLLLSFDRTAQQLSALSQEHNLLAGSAISLNWLSRGVRLSQQDVGDEQVDQMVNKTLKNFVRATMG